MELESCMARRVTSLSNQIHSPFHPLSKVICTLSYIKWFYIFSFILPGLRLLYVLAPLRMHRVRDGTVVWTGCLLLGMSQVAWLASSLLLEERPFGSDLCMTGKSRPSSGRILTSVIFNVTCVLLTLGLYTGVALMSPRTTAPSTRGSHRNIITARVSMGHWGHGS